MEKKYRVSLKVNPVTQHYRRGGHQFHTRVEPRVVSVPIIIGEAEMTAEIRNDVMLEIEEIRDEEPPQQRRIPHA